MSAPTSDPLIKNGQNPQISLRVALLVVLACANIGLLWQQTRMTATLAEQASAAARFVETQDRRLNALETQHKKANEAFDELTWMLSRPQGERPRLEVPYSLWGKLNAADRDALSREVMGEPLRMERGTPRRRPTDG